MPLFLASLVFAISLSLLPYTPPPPDDEEEEERVRQLYQKPSSSSPSSSSSSSSSSSTPLLPTSIPSFPPFHLQTPPQRPYRSLSFSHPSPPSLSHSPASSAPSSPCSSAPSSPRPESHPSPDAQQQDTPFLSSPALEVEPVKRPWTHDEPGHGLGLIEKSGHLTRPRCLSLPPSDRSIKL